MMRGGAPGGSPAARACKPDVLAFPGRPPPRSASRALGAPVRMRSKLQMGPRRRRVSDGHGGAAAAAIPTGARVDQGAPRLVLAAIALWPCLMHGIKSDSA